MKAFVRGERKAFAVGLSVPQCDADRIISMKITLHDRENPLVNEICEIFVEFSNPTKTLAREIELNELRI